VCAKKPKDNKVIECRWVFKRKRNEHNKVVSYKARLVARGFHQTDIEFLNVYSPMAKLLSVRIFLALCNEYNIPIFQLDVYSAFLYGEIQENVYITLQEGFNKSNGSVYKFRKSLYGLKNSPKKLE